MANRKVLIFGGSGMLGHTLFERLSLRKTLTVWATFRNSLNLKKFFSQKLAARSVENVDVYSHDSIIRALDRIQPDVVVNCIGIVKQLRQAKDPVVSIWVNALFPHRLAQACKTTQTRMIHISTDCVFSGKKGRYRETDPADAVDLYGKSKHLGEVIAPHCLTIRTSIIGHELSGGYGLIEWFLNQKGSVKGYTQSIFSGFTTVEIADLIAEYILPNPDLGGLYHVSTEAISKFELLQLVAKTYGKNIGIIPCGDVICDRSLDSGRFLSTTGYKPPSWPELIEKMYVEWENRRSLLN